MFLPLSYLPCCSPRFRASFDSCIISLILVTVNSKYHFF
nr:MAG TPA: hypothetical protein [Caudoviricetes sp.]